MKPRSNNKINDIARFVAAGHSQSAANCRVLLDRIQHLESENKQLRQALAPFVKSGELLVNAHDKGDFWAYRPAGGDEYAITGRHLLDAYAVVRGVNSDE